MGQHDDVALRCAAIARVIAGNGDLGAAIADVHRLPAGLPARGLLAAGLVEAVLRRNPMVGGDIRLLDRLDGLLALAEQNPPPTPVWPRLRAAARATAIMYAAARGGVTDPHAALAELDALAAEAGDAPALRPLFESARMALGYLRAARDGDEATLRRLPEEFERFRTEHAGAGAGAGTEAGSGAGAGTEADQITELAAQMTALMAAHQRGEDVSGRLAQLAEAADRLPPGHYLREAVREATSSLRLVLDAASGGVTDERIAAATAQADRSDLDDAERALSHAQAAAALLGAGRETDLGKVEAGIAHLRSAVRLTPVTHPQRIFQLTGLALGLFRRAELTNALVGLDEAVGLLTEAGDLAGGPQHPQWTMITEMRSEVERRLGRASQPHKIALDGLRGHTWRVLLQADLTAASLAARNAAGDAVDVARRCLMAGDPADAIQALDAGRGLALFAATEVRTVAARLATAGRADLARRWSDAVASDDPAPLSTDLRREVLTVLSEHGSTAALLDPPSLDEIRDALATLDADALVYLLPGEDAMPGFAVVAPVEGPPSYLALPNLHLADELDVERYLTASARRDATPAELDRGATDAEPDRGVAVVETYREAAAAGAPARDMGEPGDADQEFVGSLDRLCDWAWRAAIGPLVEQYLPRLAGRAVDRPPRVVLVPMGELARIPWQAARRPDGAYAVQLVAVSQVASARMLCHSAGLAPVPLLPLGLLVGDPDTALTSVQDLTAARCEAYAIREHFYRGARYLGRRPDGSVSPSGGGTRKDVEEWLGAAGPAAGAMLHLACHGFLSTARDAATSYLLLAGGERLTAEELATLMARSPERAIGLVVLAACRTSLAISGYDEAYSLGTAFLAGGARSVLSTQWRIPDDATSVLMFMFHHYLMADGRPAWAALRYAQLWMLDPDRKVPDRMPDELRRQLAGADPGAVVAWAGFVHSGQ